MKVWLGIVVAALFGFVSTDSFAPLALDELGKQYFTSVEVPPSMDFQLVFDPIPNTNNVPPLRFPADVDLIQTANFNVNFNPADCQGTVTPWPAAASAAFSYATTIWGALVSSPVTIEINACWRNDLAANILANAGSTFLLHNFSGAPLSDTFYSSSLANSLAGVDLWPDVADIRSNFNSNFTDITYFGIDGNPPTNQVDFVSVVMHEIGHGLGVFGTMDVSGAEGRWGVSLSADPFIPLPSAFDQFSTDGSGVSVLSTSTYGNPSAELANLFTSGDVFFNGRSTINANSGAPAAIFAPNPYMPGASLNHLDDGTFDGTPNALMTHAFAFGEVAHDPGPIGLALLIDQGWVVNPILNPLPEIVAPTGGSTLGFPAEIVNWSANGTNVDEWWIYAGSSIGANNYHDSGNLLSSLSETVNGLPGDGSTVHVRLWYRQTGGAWSFVDTTYLASDIGGPIEISSPAAGETLTSSTVTFDWGANGLSIDEWWLFLGSSTGALNYHNSTNLLRALSTTVSGLPTDGSTVYARLWHRQTGGSWSFVDSTYTASTVSTTLPSLTAPIPGSMLTGGAQNFVWSANGSNVDEWWVYVGSSVGANNHYDSANLFNTLSTTVDGLPNDGSILHVRLWYRATGDAWSFIDSTYVADNSGPAVISPVADSVLSNPSEVFSWSANSSSVDEWWLYAGSSLGGSDYFDSGNLSGGLTTTVFGLPGPSEPVYIRLWYRQSGGAWSFVDTAYN